MSSFALPDDRASFLINAARNLDVERLREGQRNGFVFKGVHDEDGRNLADIVNTATFELSSGRGAVLGDGSSRQQKSFVESANQCLVVLSKEGVVSSRRFLEDFVKSAKDALMRTRGMLEQCLNPESPKQTIGLSCA